MAYKNYCSSWSNEATISCTVVCIAIGISFFVIEIQERLCWINPQDNGFPHNPQQWQNRLFFREKHTTATGRTVSLWEIVSPSFLSYLSHQHLTMMQGLFFFWLFEKSFTFGVHDWFVFKAPVWQRPYFCNINFTAIQPRFPMSK